MNVAKTIVLFFLLLVVFSTQAQLKKPTVQPKKETTAKPPVKVVERVKIVEKDNDRDNDGIIDSMDKCPDEWGEMKNEGCPKNKNLYGLTDSNGSKYDYEGEVLNGLPNGKGKATYIEGHHVSFFGIKIISINKADIYKGDFSNGVKDGYGEFTGIEERYRGNWKDDKKNGFGKMIYSDSTVYEGNWQDNMRHGKGKYKWKSGLVYEGDWVNGDITGRGKYIWANGDVYEGDVVSGKMTGKGTYIWTNGTKYIGDWKDDNKHGIGEVYNSAGVLIFNGEFKDGKKIENTSGNTGAVLDDINYLKGKVVDKQGEPIIGATIRKKGTTWGTISDVNGEFELRVYTSDREKGYTVIQFKYVGYKTKEIVLGNQTNITVVLKQLKTKKYETTIQSPPRAGQT